MLRCNTFLWFFVLCDFVFFTPPPIHIWAGRCLLSLILACVMCTNLYIYRPYRTFWTYAIQINCLLIIFRLELNCCVHGSWYKNVTLLCHIMELYFYISCKWFVLFSQSFWLFAVIKVHAFMQTYTISIEYYVLPFDIQLAVNRFVCTHKKSLDSINKCLIKSIHLKFMLNCKQ